MKKTSKVILTSILTIVACVSLIAGATFALFTSESKTNIAITSAKVDLKANISKVEMKSELPGEKKDYAPMGSAELGDSTLTVSNMAPGDYVTFDLVFENESTIPVKWQLSVAVESEEHIKFLQLLNVTYGEFELVESGKAQLSAWQTALDPISVKISMPTTVEKKDVEGLTDLKLILTVTAIQANADTTDPKPDKINLHEVFDVEKLNEMLEDTEDPQQIYLLNDIDLGKDAWNALNLVAGSTFEGNGHTISFKDGDPTTFVSGAGEAVTISDVTLRLDQDFGKRCTWDAEGNTEVAWQANNADGLQEFAATVNGSSITGHALGAPVVLRDTSIAPEDKSYAGQLVELTHDIDLAGREWTPIGTDTTSFKGTFDGNGHRISNLYINQPEIKNVGFFRTSYEVSRGNYNEIKNLTIVNANVTGQQYVGVLAGNVDGTIISDCHVIGSINVTGSHYTGGLVGHANGVTIQNSSVEGQGTISGKYIETDLEGDAVGGIIGFTMDNNSTFKFENLTVSGVDIEGTRKVGGVIGYASECTVTNSTYKNGTVRCNANDEYKKNEHTKLFISGIIGEYEANSVALENSSIQNITIVANELHALANQNACVLLVGGNRYNGNITYTNNTYNGVTLVLNLAKYDDDEAYKPLDTALPLINKLTAEGGLTSTTINLAAGTYVPTANENFRIERNNVTLRGSVDENGVSTTTIAAGEHTVSDQAGFLISSHNVTVENIKFTNDSTNGNITALKASTLKENGDLALNLVLRNLIVESVAGSGLAINGVQDGVVENVTVNKYGKVGISLAQNINVRFSGLTTVAGGWADIGFMYKENDPAYARHSDISIDFASCHFGNGSIYSERKLPSDRDVISYNGRQLGNGDVVPTADDIQLRMISAENGGWAMKPILDTTVSTSEELIKVLADINTNRYLEATVRLTVGEYEPSSTEQFKITASNVTLIGEDKNNTIINGKTFSAGMAAMEVNGSNVTISGVTIKTEISEQIGVEPAGNFSALKVTFRNNAGTYTTYEELNIPKDFTLRDAIIIGCKGHGLNLHGVERATIDNVAIRDYGKCAISIAMATDVKFTNLTTVALNHWGDIGIMYGSGYDYLRHSDISIDFDSCLFGRGLIYSERPSGDPEGVDVIRNNGEQIVSGMELRDVYGENAGATSVLKMTVSQESGKWSISREASFAPTTDSEFAGALDFANGSTGDITVNGPESMNTKDEGIANIPGYADNGTDLNTSGILTIDGKQADGSLMTINFEHTAFNHHDGLEGIKTGTIIIRNVHFIGRGADCYVMTIGFDANVNVTFENCIFEDMYCAIYCNPITAEKSLVSITIRDCEYRNTLYGYSVDNTSDDSKVVVTYENIVSGPEKASEFDKDYQQKH